MSDAVDDRRTHLRTLGLAAFGAMAAMRCGDPMLTTLAAEFDRPLAEAAQVVSAFAIGYGVLQLLYGPLGDRYGALRIVALAAAGCAVACVLAALSASFGMLVATRGLMGAAAAGIVPLSMAWIGDNFDYGDRQKTLSRLLTATVGGMIAGQWLGAWITDVLSWHAVFALLAVLFAAAACLLWRRAGPAGRPASAGASAGASSAAMLRLLAVGRVRRVLSAAAIEGFAMVGVLAFIPSLLVQKHGLGLAEAGAVLSLYGVGGLLFSRTAGPLLKTFGERGLAVAGGGLAGVALLVLAWASRWEAAPPACLAAGAGFYMLHTTLQTQATQMAPERRGMAVAWFACLLFIGQSAGVTLMAVAVGQGLAAPAMTACAVVLIALGGGVARGLSSQRNQGGLS